MCDLVCFIDRNIITRRLNSRSDTMTSSFDRVPLLFMGFVFITFSLVILYSDDCISGSLSTSPFIILVPIFVPIIFLCLCLCLFYNIT